MASKKSYKEFDNEKNSCGLKIRTPHFLMGCPSRPWSAQFFPTPHPLKIYFCLVTIMMTRKP